jgi:hypothetical protein
MLQMLFLKKLKTHSKKDMTIDTEIEIFQSSDHESKVICTPEEERNSE